MGRNRVVEPKNRVMTVRVSEEEYSMLLDIQSKNGAIFSEIIRKAIAFYCNFIRQTRG